MSHSLFLSLLFGAMVLVPFGIAPQARANKTQQNGTASPKKPKKGRTVTRKALDRMVKT